VAPVTAQVAWRVVYALAGVEVGIVLVSGNWWGLLAVAFVAFLAEGMRRLS
jgi:hypothetical protein